MKHRIESVDSGSICHELGIAADDFLVAIDGHTVYDVIDYEALTYAECLRLSFEKSTGEMIECEVDKESYEPLGLNFSSGLMSPVRQCANHCVFCFIDQMPRGNRNTLYFKDDDWRLSLIMGNYVTLTNVSETEFSRIIERRVSPLYISVHATDGAVRKAMMRSRNADLIMDRLQRLSAAGLSFHSQIVLCPGYNDKAVLKNTLEDLYSLYPYARSVAIVPVGLTAHRDGLAPVSPVSPQSAAETLALIEGFKAEHNIDGFAYASDELYLCAGMPLPQYDYYGDFEQIENGVGLFRLFEHGFIETLCELPHTDCSVNLDSLCGVSIAPLMQQLFLQLKNYGIDIAVHTVINDFFGRTVTVSGLVTAGDIIKQYKGRLFGKAVLIPRTMLREGDAVFLDGIRLEQLSSELERPVFPVSASDGIDFIYDIIDICERIKE